MSFPEPAIRWLVCHADSNAELACLSNVCRKWREIAVNTVVDQAKDSLSDDAGKNPPLLLLLPSMGRSLLCKNRSTQNDFESYCLAWFHPDGIKFKQLSLDALNDSEDDDEVMHARDHRGDSPPPFAPSGEQSYAGSEEERKPLRRRSPTPLLAAASAGLRGLEPPGERVNCMYQWNGYREAIEVLRPFGYAHDFVKRVIKLARSVSDKMQEDDSEPASAQEKNKTSIFPLHKTFAVRGATFARPEGYCLCWDHDLSVIEAHAQQFSNGSKPSVSEQAMHQRLRRRKRRRRELQREVLPRVLYSAPNKGDRDSQLGIRQPCIQFLNIDSSHAVRLFTPPFKPGPVPAPITVFCVAIATEDGCFFSGLKNRFELGHLYPESMPDSLIERSAISICTDLRQAPAPGGYDDEDEGSDVNKQASYNSDDSSCDMSLEAASGDPGLKCMCPFSGMGDADEDAVESPVEVCRGKRGPGLWHCYVAVFDGVSSSIRIDGAPEPLRCNATISSPFGTYLDGLTIGADHTFDMSLCFGQGSDGEGEGAMAELAVFKGRLDETDIGVLERYLMTKHGIPSPVLPDADIAVEDQYSRLAHAMLSHPPYHSVFAKGLTRVPLRYMTKHRMVSWKQANPVTGEAIRVQRIGSKFGDSSSDW